MHGALSKVTPRELLEAGPPAIARLARQLPFSLEELADGQEDYAIFYAPESFSCDRLELPPSSGVVIDGDLSVSDLLDARPLYEDPENLRFLVVAGALRTRLALLGCETHVGGSVEVEDTLIAESDGHASLHVGGDLRARVIIALGHHVAVGGTTTADFKIGFLGLASDVPKTSMAQTFKPELVNPWGGIEIERVADTVLAGESPFAR